MLCLHLHPEHGSAYWLRRQSEFGWSLRDRIRTLDDLDRLGPMPLEDLRRFPVRDFIPRAFHRALGRFVVGETAGTRGEPCATAYRADEFRAAFVTPFIRAARGAGFPSGAPWLWIGPSGPHIIGKAARELARRSGAMEAFGVDFDPRWAKRLAEGSLARERYLEHVIDQALDVLRREAVGVLFTTPPVLASLVGRMTDREREAIHGVHYGGVRITADALNGYRDALPNAVHLAGYGNTLFGVLMELADDPRLALDYFPHGDRVHFRLIAAAEPAANGVPWPPRDAVAGSRGRLLFHRFDESCLLLNVIERDEAEWVRAPAHAGARGYTALGLRDPGPPEQAGSRLRIGLY